MRTRVLLGVAAATAMAAAATAWILEHPDRVREAFVGALAHGRYADAAEMLVVPSAIEAGPDGTLTVVDDRGATTLVPPEKLPFLASEASPPRPGEFTMTALGPSANGVLATPALTLRLRLDGGKVRIVGVDS